MTGWVRGSKYVSPALAFRIPLRVHRNNMRTSNYQMRETTRQDGLTCRIDIARIPNREKA
jgi:hypothetical protein